ncbi:MAG: hypothetical protein AAF847_17215, partial [Bacteroidota bacterium]
MHKNNLFRLLERLDRKEMTRFREFVQSPYFNKHEKVIALVQHLSDIYPNFHSKQCDRKHLFKIVFGQKKHDQAQLAIIFTYTKNLLRTFLAQEQLQANELEQQTALLIQMRTKTYFKGYEKALKSSENWLEAYPHKDAQFQYASYRIAKETDQYYEQLRQYKSDDSLQRKQNHLDYFYLSEKLRDACEILVRESTLQVAYSSRLLDVLVAEVTQNWTYYQGIPSIAVYYQIYQMLRQRSVESYLRTLEVVAQNVQFFSRKEQQAAYLYLQNF